MGWNSVGNVLSSGLSVHVFCMMLAEIIFISKLKVAENKMFCVSSQLDLQKKRSTLIYFTSVFVSGIVVWNNDISPCQCLVLMNTPWLFINNLFLKSRGKILTLFHLSEILNGWGWHSVARTFSLCCLSSCLQLMWLKWMRCRWRQGHIDAKSSWHLCV